MKYFGYGLSDKHKELAKIINRPYEAEQAKKLFLEIHEKLHLSTVSESEPNEVDALLSDLSPWEYAVMPKQEDETIAWAIWHIARIEDITINILVNEKEQVFNNSWQKKMNSPITDTGNALNDAEIMVLSKSLNIVQLIAYRNAVGKRTRESFKELSPTSFKKKVSQKCLDKILKEGGVTYHKDSIWLLDFWGKKDISSLLLMPPTRHEIMHLNDCCKWKKVIRTKKKFFLS